MEQQIEHRHALREYGGHMMSGGGFVCHGCNTFFGADWITAREAATDRLLEAAQEALAHLDELGHESCSDPLRAAIAEVEKQP